MYLIHKGSLTVAKDWICSEDAAVTSPVRHTWCTAHWMARMPGFYRCRTGIRPPRGTPDAMMATVLSSDYNRIKWWSWGLGGLWPGWLVTMRPKGFVNLSNQAQLQGAFVDFPWLKPSFLSENLSLKSFLSHQGIREVTKHRNSKIWRAKQIPISNF